jgi:hypothetical protein
MTPNRTHTRATNSPSPRQADDALSRLANAVIDTMAVRDADQGQAFRDALAVAISNNQVGAEA